MDSNSANDRSDNERSVDEGAFWHTNMDLYYGYMPGEVVEVEHEPNKYWLASIQYCYKHLVLLKWVGNYGSVFWVDTSTTNSPSSSTTSSCGAPSEPFSNPKRLYALGHHMQGQLKSQFDLEKPSKILVKPSWYNPSRDPYANIRTVQDLLVHEVKEQNIDDGWSAPNRSTSDTASIALAKCKNKINYGQEDEEELEAALQSLNGLADWERTESPQDHQIEQEPPTQGGSTLPKTNGVQAENKKPAEGAAANSNDVQTSGSPKCPTPVAESSEIWTDGVLKRKEYNLQPPGFEECIGVWRKVAGLPDMWSTRNKHLRSPTDTPSPDSSSEIEFEEEELSEAAHDEKCFKLCKDILDTATTKGKYFGVHDSGVKRSDTIFPTKPKLVYDVGGANHERLFSRGTLLSICHTIEDELGNLDVFQWIAFVVKNVGGRLTLRWFLCDEPKFKQGRLEMKSCLSKLVAEEAEQTTGDTSDSNKNPEGLIDSGSPPVVTKSDYITSQSLTFSMHFCNPRIQIRFSNAVKSGKHEPDMEFKLPDEISSHMLKTVGREASANLEKSQLDHVFDTRRINLDRDRPLISHFLTVAQSKAPIYLDLIFARKDTNSRREVLISCPRMTKLIRATIKRELRFGVFEVHSEPLNGSDEIIKFVYPYDSSYTILPLEWSKNNQDCLSIHPSRNPSPTIPPQVDEDGKIDDDTKQQSESEASHDKTEPTEEKTGMSHHEVGTGSPSKYCFKDISQLPLVGSPYKPFDHDDREQALPPDLQICGGEREWTIDWAWSHILHLRELNSPSFHCCIDDTLEYDVTRQFQVMDHVEIFHPTSNSIICTGRIRKVVFPMLWIQLSSDYYTLVPFNLTDIYPVGWCEANEHKLVSLLPPRRRCADEDAATRQSEKRSRKKVKISHKGKNGGRAPEPSSADDRNESENFDLVKLNDRQADIGYMINEKSSYIKIFFNHKCFTGPSLSKSKICTLPQYVGPGAMSLVIEEVVTKLISVAYVPPRILNDLSSGSFEELLTERGLTNTVPAEFKAKYQKRVHREMIPVCVNPNDVALYCECMCEHIKCCYNLFGMNLYDGDFCPSNCRSLTKSNKFMKRATYYREKARQGEFVSQPNSSSTTNIKDNTNSLTNNNRDSNKNGNKRTTANHPNNTNTATISNANTSDIIPGAPSIENSKPETIIKDTTNRARYIGRGSSESTNSTNISRSDEDLNTGRHLKIDEWTTEDVAQYMEESELGIFKAYMQAEGIDGPALMLLDRPTIEEHFQLDTNITQEDVNKLCDLADWCRTISKIGMTL